MAKFYRPAYLPSEPHQPFDFKFPVRQFFDGKMCRSFDPNWFSNWKWIHYDISLDLVFCHSCLMCVLSFKISPKDPRLNDPFVSGGFSNWLESYLPFQIHENSHLHQDCLSHLEVSKGEAESKENQHTINVLIVGDRGCGKHTLMKAIKSLLNPTNSQETDGWMRIDYNIVHFKFTILSGYAQVEELLNREYFLSYVILVCFSINGFESWLSVEKHYLPLVFKYKSYDSLLLVGNKGDLLMSTAAIIRIQLRIDHKQIPGVSSSNYVECSALRQLKIIDVLEKICSIYSSTLCDSLV